MRWKRGNRLKLVDEADAPARTQEVFAQIRQLFGVPVVPFLYRAYAAYPDFLAFHWQTFRPALESRQFFQLSDRLAAEAYTRAHNYFEVRDMTSRLPAEPSPELRPCLPLARALDYYQYVDPLLLLIAATQMQALEGPVGKPQEIAAPVEHAAFLAAPTLITDAEASAGTQRIWEDRRRLLDSAFISDEHRAMAMWPSFYHDYWMGLRELMTSPLYDDTRYRISESAISMADELPSRLETSIPHLLENGMSEEDVSSLARINETMLHALSGLVLDVLFARIGLEGGTHRRQRQQETHENQPSSKSAGSPTRAA